jgi:GDP-L-fucose synthase
MDDAKYDTDAASGAVSPLDRGAPLWIAGHRGLVGSSIWDLFEREGFGRLIGRTSSDLDLTNRTTVFEFVAAQRPKAVVLAAAYVGGIIANNTYPADFISRNLQIQINVMDAAAAHGVERLLFFGSSCIYPKFAPQPLKEEYLLTGRLESTNEAFALAKLAGIAQVRAVRRQYGLPWISVLPSNLYGPRDNFSENGSHVLSALIRRFSEAVATGAESVTNWGTGTPRREFLYVDDLSSACLHLLDDYNMPLPINIGTGVDHSIAELSSMVADAVGYHGDIRWDVSKPDGTPQKLLDVARLNGLGWRSSTDIVTGIGSTLDWYQRCRADIRC